jgi:hypothetical protein
MVRLLTLLTIAATLSACGTTGQEFSLYTHCGIRHVIVDGIVYLADPVLDDGQGNPPRGWENPSQQGNLRINPDGSADFTSGPLSAHFVRTELAVSELPICS